MNPKAYKHKRKSAKIAQPALERTIDEVRQITSAIYVVRVAPSLVDRVSRIFAASKVRP